MRWYAAFRATPIYILMLALTVGWRAAHRQQELRVTFLDVGQGDAEVIEVTVSDKVMVRSRPSR